MYRKYKCIIILIRLHFVIIIIIVIIIFIIIVKSEECLFLSPQGEVDPWTFPLTSYISPPFRFILQCLLGILFVSILCECCRHLCWYCSVSQTVFCTPSLSLTEWFLSRSNKVISNKCLKILFVMLSVFFRPFSWAPRLRYRIWRPLFCNIVDS